ncbi:hypothetical protein DRQ33_07200 [bacterium]|nr:MAG: hypothetical protein DRQ33_07200 [bacterium]
MKRYSIIIVPDGSDNPMKIWLSGKWIVLLSIVLFVFISINVVFLSWNIISSFDSETVRRENKILRESLSITQARMDSLAGLFQILAQKNRLLYTISDVPEPEIEYAVGGPQIADYEKNFSLNKLAFQIDSLLFVARQELASMDSVNIVLSQREKILRHTPSIKPMRGFYSSGFGKRLDPLTGTWRMHEGLDICAPKGTPVRSAADGRVKFAGWRSGFGKMVIIDHIWFETRYAHLNEIKVKRGQKITRGDVVGTCGRTGRTTGVHLHYEVRIAGKPVNPRDYILPQSVCVD